MCRQTTSEELIQIAEVFDCVAVVLTRKRKNHPFAYRYCNNAFKKFVGSNSPDLTGATPLDQYDQSTAQRLMERHERCVGRGKPVAFRETLPMFGQSRQFAGVLQPLDFGTSEQGVLAICHPLDVQDDIEALRHVFHHVGCQLAIGTIQAASLIHGLSTLSRKVDDPSVRDGLEKLQGLTRMLDHGIRNMSRSMAAVTPPEREIDNQQKMQVGSRAIRAVERILDFEDVRRDAVRAGQR